MSKYMSVYVLKVQVLVCRLIDVTCPIFNMHIFIAALAAKGSLPLWIAKEWISEYGERQAGLLAEEANRPVSMLTCTREEWKQHLFRNPLIKSFMRTSLPLYIFLSFPPILWGSLLGPCDITLEPTAMPKQ